MDTTTRIMEQVADLDYQIHVKQQREAEILAEIARERSKDERMGLRSGEFGGNSSLRSLMAELRENRRAQERFQAELYNAYR